MFDYFHANENEQYLFLQMPLMLIKDEQFKGLSDGAKILYSLLLNRTSLSAKNGWTDDEGRIYIIYTIEEIMTDLNCWEKKATKSMKELKEIGLVKSVRQGLGKPNIIYVMNFATALKYKDKESISPVNAMNTLNCQKDNSRVVKRTIQEPVKRTIQELSKGQCIYIDINKIYNNDIESESLSLSQIVETQEQKPDRTRTIDSGSTEKENSLKNKKGLPQTAADQSTGLQSPRKTIANTSAENDYTTYEKIIKENISYQYFLQDRSNIALVDNFVAAIVDTMLTDDDVKITIGRGSNKEVKPISVIKSVLMRLNHEHIQHAIDQFKKQHHKITYKRPYMRNTLYNTYIEMDAHYTNQVRADGAVW